MVLAILSLKSPVQATGWSPVMTVHWHTDLAPAPPKPDWKVYHLRGQGQLGYRSVAILILRRAMSHPTEKLEWFMA